MKMDYAKRNETLDFKPSIGLHIIEDKMNEITLNRPFTELENLKKPRWMRLGRYVLELCLINAAFVNAYAMRFYFQLGSDVYPEYQTPLSEYLGIQLGFTLSMFVILHLRGFYRMQRIAGYLDEVGNIISSTFISMGILMVALYIMRPFDPSRLMFVYLLVLSIIFLSLERLGVRAIYRALWSRGIWVSNTLVVGTTDVAMRLIHGIVQRPSTGYRVVGYVDDEERFSKWTLRANYGKRGDKQSEVNLLGPISKLTELIRKKDIKQVFVALPGSEHDLIDEVIQQCRMMGVAFTLVPDIYALKINTLSIQELNGVPLISYDVNKLTGWNYFLKRSMDIVLSLIAILITAIPMLLVALAVRLDSPGSVLFRQTRVGKDGKLFTCFKFRSMYVNADEMLAKLKGFNQTGGVTFKMKDDPRRTRVGKFIRRTSLDELPQFFNILLGQMSFAGPRPPIPREVERYDDWHYRRLEVTPGLTGLWQVSGRSNISYEEMVKLDIYYAEHWSPWLDLKIILKTIPAVLNGDGAF
ncbi:sugar transferase [Candidatus Chlorohelix allophototropha]|uniref:Sugar transferase n=2 Tax=Candidatus Chlorohelix allophototropha TaxID=3003348 RepID=A0ABY9B298_9CHLR|nr:sugar transferase [Chloroflexota bacterium L227-S17]